MSRSTGPFGQPSSSNLAVNGLVSFNPSMHGTPSLDDVSYAELSQETAQKIASLQAKLNQKLGPEYLSQRPGPGGGSKLTYIEGWKVINVANEVFGFNGWSSSIVNLTTDYMDYNEQNQRYNIGVTAIVRVTLRDGVFHEDIGYGTIDNAKGKGAALDKCKKEAVTDALKRALRAFGNLLGNCLYDKSYVSEVVKIKVPQQKFDKTELYRRPEFEERSASGTAPAVKTEPVSVPPPRPQAPQPKHANQTPKPKSGPSYPAGMGPPGGLNTPITTPQQQNRVSARPPVLHQPPVAAQPAPAPAAAAPVVPPQQPPNPKPVDNQSPGSDEFAFYADDEEILANVDAEIDMGRPIGGEEEQESLHANASMVSATTTGTNASSGNRTMLPPPLPPPNPVRSSSTTTRGGGFISGTASSSTGNPPRGGFISNAQHPRAGGFMTPAGASSSSTANAHRTNTGGTNTPTPSTRRPGGGFHFPAGITHEQLQRTPLAPLPVSNNSSSSLSTTMSSGGYTDSVGVGMKRKMDDSGGGGGGGGGGGRRMGPGMGLLHSNPTPSGRQNQFGNNGAFGDDTKRMKR